jgi:hypothetical protein
MNERIKELLDQCKVEKHTGPPWVEYDKEKLAELVISECCGAFWTKECSYSDLAYEEYTKRVNTIKQHFGIE